MNSLNSKKIQDRATSSSFLKKRISFNKKYQKINFVTWQYQIYSKIISKFFDKKDFLKIKILDVGSGDGLQVSHFIKIFSNPEIWCLDYSKKSLNTIKKRFKSKNIKVIKLDMDNLQNFIKKRKLKKYFHIAHSSYALYYSKNQVKVLNSMKSSLVKKGLFLISAPSEPHEMVNFINKIYKIPNKVLNTLKFYKKVLIPYLKKNCQKSILKKKINYLNFNKTSEFIDFWKNTTYYNSKVVNKVTKKLKDRKSLKFKKISAIAAAINK